MKKVIPTLIVIMLFIAIFFLSILNYGDNKKVVEEIITTPKESEFNLPIVVINTNGNKIEDDSQIIGDFSLKNIENEINSKINIKLRGSSSKTYPKKQYGFEFINDNGKEKDIRVLGMSNDSDWILNGPFADKSLIRNYLAYNITGNFMKYSPRVRYCEVFILENGETEITKDSYKGVYLITEKIKRNDQRVDIEKSNKRMKETSFIVVRDRVKAGDMFYRNYGSETYLSDNKIVNNYPKEPTEIQEKYITKTISEFERVLYSERFKSKEEGYINHIDEESFINYYIVNEFFKNTDSGIFSTYFYRDLGGKIVAGPIWDFNASLGNYELGDIKYNDPTGFYMAQTPWFSRLLQDPSFVANVNLQYTSLRKSFLSDEYLLNFIDETIQILGSAIKRNYERWPFQLSNQESYFRTHPDILSKFNGDTVLLNEYMINNPTKFVNTEQMAKNYEEEITMLRNFIIKRGEWMDENIRSLYKFTN
ncbi:MAG: CotH kinase family protein [Clostridium sp.]